MVESGSKSSGSVRAEDGTFGTGRAQRTWKRPSLRNVAFDSVDLVDQCEARASSKKSTGERCARKPAKGWNLCWQHMTDKEREMVKQAGNTVAQVEQMRRYVNPIPVSDMEANPLVAFSMEFRRCIGLIRFYEEQVNKINDERDLVWGKVQEEQIQASEWPGLNTKWAQQENMWLTLLNKERDRLLALEKVWLAANLGAQQLELMQRVVGSLDFAVQRVLTRLGLDVNDRAVRKVVRDELSGLSGRVAPPAKGDR